MPKNEKKPLSKGISKLAEVIKQHEGWNKKGLKQPNRPQRNNNPGNLKASPFSNEKDKDGFCIFPDKKTGEKALNYQLEIIFTGDSKAYKPSFTIEKFVNKYAGNPPKEYIKAVAEAFNTTKDKTLKEAFEKNGYDISGKSSRGKDGSSGGSRGSGGGSGSGGGNKGGGSGGGSGGSGSGSGG